MLLNIIFSFNRAMQLDFLLQSVLDKYKITYRIVVLYHTTGNHAAGYKKLIIKYETYDFITFVERQNTIFDPAYLTGIKDLNSLKFSLKKSRLYNPKSDNFKGLLESTMEHSNCEFVMFNTDDGVYINDLNPNPNHLSIIKNNPYRASYRSFVGLNHIDIPNHVGEWHDGCLWDYYSDEKLNHWSYPFSVDGTIYNRKGLLKILRKIAYHNPVTLEERGYTYMKKNRLMNIGLSPKQTVLVCTKLNRVSVDSSNPTIHISTDLLNNYFLDDYTLDLNLPSPSNNANVVPNEVFIKKGNKKISLYNIDENGKEIQSLLGAEGAKVQRI